MSNLLTDRGIQASTAAAAVLALITAVAYSPPLLAIWVAWAAVTMWAIIRARS